MLRSFKGDGEQRRGNEVLGVVEMESEGFRPNRGWSSTVGFSCSSFFVVIGPAVL